MDDADVDADETVTVVRVSGVAPVVSAQRGNDDTAASHSQMLFRHRPS